MAGRALERPGFLPGRSGFPCMLGCSVSPAGAVGSDEPNVSSAPHSNGRRRTPSRWRRLWERPMNPWRSPWHGSCHRCRRFRRGSRRRRCRSMRERHFRKRCEGRLSTGPDGMTGTGRPAIAGIRALTRVHRAGACSCVSSSHASHPSIVRMNDVENDDDADVGHRAVSLFAAGTFPVPERHQRPEQPPASRTGGSRQFRRPRIQI